MSFLYSTLTTISKLALRPLGSERLIFIFATESLALIALVASKRRELGWKIMYEGDYTVTVMSEGFELFSSTR